MGIALNRFDDEVLAWAEAFYRKRTADVAAGVSKKPIDLRPDAAWVHRIAMRVPLDVRRAVGRLLDRVFSTRRGYWVTPVLPSITGDMYMMSTNATNAGREVRANWEAFVAMKVVGELLDELRGMGGSIRIEWENYDVVFERDDHLAVAIETKERDRQARRLADGIEVALATGNAPLRDAAKKLGYLRAHPPEVFEVRGPRFRRTWVVDVAGKAPWGVLLQRRDGHTLRSLLRP